MNYSISWLQDQIKNNIPIKYLFFWGHTQKKESEIVKSCFSQWYPAIFKVDGILYPTAEHWMMVKKALLFDDQEQVQNILQTDSPAKAKKFGRAVKNFSPAVWENHAFSLVGEGNKHKFSQNRELKDFLLNTHNAVIVEASPFDKIWGIGTNTHETNPSNWKGTNLLGFALMKTRDFLK